MQPVRIVVYSDFLCPWCFNAATRLRALEDELGGALALEWKAFLLRPVAKPGRDLEKFRDYTKGWLRVGEDEPRAPFQVWQSDAGPPTHSVPAHVAALAAAELGPAAERAMRERLFHAYFAESRDISAPETLRALWNELDLAPDAFARCESPALEERVRAEHAEAVELGATGVPAARLASSEHVIVGALPEATYRRWIERTLAN